MTQRDLRCDSKKQAVLIEGGMLEIKCTSRFCGARRGVVVIHRFDLETGDMVSTMKFKNPTKQEGR